MGKKAKSAKKGADTMDVGDGGAGEWATVAPSAMMTGPEPVVAEPKKPNAPGTKALRVRATSMKRSTKLRKAKKLTRSLGYFDRKETKRGKDAHRMELKTRMKNIY